MAEDKYSYSQASTSDTYEVLQFLMEHFRNEESLCRAVNMTVDQCAECFEDIVRRSLSTPFSTIAREKSELEAIYETGKMVAVLLISMWSRGHDADEDPGFLLDENQTGPAAISYILNKLHSSFWQLVPTTVNTVLHREICSVAKEFQRQGIASELMRESNKRAKSSNYEIGGYVSETSSLANQILLKKNGFQAINEIYLSEVVDSSGKQIIQCDDGTEKVVLNFKPWTS